MVGGPNGSDPAEEAQVDSRYRSFTGLLGATPAFMNGYIDQNQPIMDWAANASWTAWSWRQSPIAQNVIPVLGLPMATGADAGQQDAVFKEFASGAHDDVLREIVQAWQAQGYASLYIRPGYEMNGDFTPWYADANAADRADWVAAFRHIATVVRSVPGSDVKVVWNPNIQAGNSADVTGLYPGNAFVDVIAGDIYSPMYPRDLYDWAKNDGTVDNTFAEWAANPVNRAHYWTYPAGSQFAPLNDGGSNTFSLQDLIDFAKANGKPVGIAETGAGGNGTRGPIDDPAFPQWLASTLANAGVPISFVNIWDLDPGDGNWEFSSPQAGKPLEAAAWAKYFGAAPITVAPPPPAVVTVGSGPDTIALQMSEDAWAGDAQFTIRVDGATFDGVTVAHATASLYSNGAASIPIPATAAKAADAVAAPALDTIGFDLSEDAWAGDAQCVLTLDGLQLGSMQTITAPHALGQLQHLSFTGEFDAGPHAVSVAFINDAYGGAEGLDLILYVDAVRFDGHTVSGANTALYWDSSADFAIPVPAAAVVTLPGTFAPFSLLPSH